MTRLALVTVAESGDKGDIKKHQNTVLFSLKDADVSIRRRALDVLFVMCDSSNAESIVKELVDFLVVADVTLKVRPHRPCRTLLDLTHHSLLA